MYVGHLYHVYLLVCPVCRAVSLCARGAVAAAGQWARSGWRRRSMSDTTSWPAKRTPWRETEVAAMEHPSSDLDMAGCAQQCQRGGGGGEASREGATERG